MNGFSPGAYGDLSECYVEAHVMNKPIVLVAAMSLAALAGCGSPPPARTTTTTTTIERSPQAAPYSSTETTVDENGQVVKRTQTYTTESPAPSRETTIERSFDHR